MKIMINVINSYNKNEKELKKKNYEIKKEKRQR